MRRYRTHLKKSSHRRIRERLYRSLESKEYRYHHAIPTRAVGRTLKALNLTAFHTNKRDVLIISSRKDRRVEHGRALVQKGKIVGWYVK